MIGRQQSPLRTANAPALRLLQPQNNAPTLPLESRSDDELMLLTRGGLRSAFDVLVRRHQRAVLGAAQRYLGSESLAADCAQNAFVEVYRARDCYQPRGKFTGFLFRVVYNQCRMIVRAGGSEKRRREHLAAERLGDLSSEEDSATAESRLLQREREREVELAVAQLSEKQRAVVMLRYGADLSYLEIAASLELPLGTVKRRLFDATAKLQAMLGGAP